MNASDKDAISYALYPEVFESYIKYIREYGDLSRMGSDIFFHGLKEGETCEIEIAEGKTLIIKLLEIGKLDTEGYRILAFEVNGNRRELKIKDKEESVLKAESSKEAIVSADADNDKEIGASIPGNILKVLVKEGDTVKKGQSLIVIEAMKMETNVVSRTSGVIEKIFVKEQNQVKTGQLLIRLQ